MPQREKELLNHPTASTCFRFVVWTYSDSETVKDLVWRRRRSVLELGELSLEDPTHTGALCRHPRHCLDDDNVEDEERDDGDHCPVLCIFLLLSCSLHFSSKLRRLDS